VRAVGEEAIQIDFRYKGRKRERLRLAPTKANLAWCRGLKRRIEDEIAHGTFVYAKYFPDSKHARASGGPLLVEAVRAYCESLAGQVEPETLRDYRRNGEIVAQGIGGTLLGLTRKKVRDWVTTQTLSKSRIDNLLIPLRGTLRQAVEDEVIAQSPLDKFEVRRVGIRKETIDPFTPAEVHALGKEGDLWTFWAWTGLRSGEIIGLQWRDVDSSMAAIEIRRAVRLGREKEPKTRAGRRHVHILPPAVAVLRRLHRGRDSDPVWRNPETGKDWHEAKALNRAFQRACKAAGVRFRYSYQLRHTYATWALSSGENPAWIAKQMGHGDASILFKHYAKWMPQLDPKAGSRMVAKARRGQRAA
jgi:integrase